MTDRPDLEDTAPTDPSLVKQSETDPVSPRGRAFRTMRTWSGAAITGLIALLSGGANGLLVSGGLVALPLALLTPTGDYSLDQLNPPTQRTFVLHSSDGQPFARRGGCVAESVRLAEVPEHFIDALLSMEDRWFHYHLGLDPIGLSRAMYRNWEADGVVQGGSTITQQLVKNAFLSRDKTYERKQKEAMLAVWLELRLSKAEILERYLSRVYLGDGCFGLRAATRHYFDKPVTALTLAESAYLVALIKSPSHLASNLAAAQARARLVLEAMVENAVLPAGKAVATPPAVPRLAPEDRFGGYYADWVASTIEVTEGRDYAPLPVQTTLDPQLQRLAENAFASVLGKKGSDRRAGQGAMVVMRRDGTVVAMIGGRDYAASRFNRAVQAQRQPGSSFKLFVYLAALRAGVTPDTKVTDEAITIGDYEPKNFGRNHRGDVTVSAAFASSINTVAVRLSEAVGRDSVIQAARDLGINSHLEATPSLALGAWEVNLLELTSAYAAVAAGAYPVKPWAITAFGAPLDGAVLPPIGSGAWTLVANDDLRTLLAGVVRFGSGRGARLSVASYGKTGTSQDYRDAWFLGFAGDLILGVWVGNDDFTPMRNVTGGSLPAEIWRAFMVKALESEKDRARIAPQVVAFTPKARKDLHPVRIAADLLSQGATPGEDVLGGSDFGVPPADGFRGRWGNRWAERGQTQPKRGGRKGRGLFGRLFN